MEPRHGYQNYNLWAVKSVNVLPPLYLGLEFYESKSIIWFFLFFFLHGGVLQLWKPL